MRIAIAGETYYPGNNGQAIFTIHLAEGLARAGHDVHMLTTSPSLRYRREQINGVTVHLLPGIGFDWIHPGVSLAVLPELSVQRVFAEFPPDVVHIQDHYFLCHAVEGVARRLNLPIIGTNHFLPGNVLHYLRAVPLPQPWKARILWALMLWTYNHLNVVTTPTETGAAILHNQSIRVPVVPVSCGVDTHIFSPGSSLRQEFDLDPTKTVFLYVGRHDREKRIDLLIRALAYLYQHGRTDFQLALAGQGAAKEELMALAGSLGFTGDQVRFLGYVPAEKLPDLYRAADIFAMPSPEELQSIATLEAMASGKPILAANARALPELVSSGGNGLLFQPGQVESAARAMLDLANGRSEWPRMGRASRTRAMTHSLENTISRYLAIYQAAAARRPVLTGRPGMRLNPAGRD